MVPMAPGDVAEVVTERLKLEGNPEGRDESAEATGSAHCEERNYLGLD